MSFPFQVLRVATGLYSYKTVDESWLSGQRTAFRKKTEAKKIAKKRKRLVKRQTCLFTLLVTRLSLILHFKLNVFFFFNFFRTETYPLHFCVSRVFKY